FSSRRRHTRSKRDWSSDVCSSDLWRLSVYRNFRWGNPGGANQMEFHWSGLLNCIRRGFTGSYLDAAHFYSMVAEKGFPFLDGDSWKNHPGDMNGSGFPSQASANSTLAFQNWADEEHKH